MTNTTSGVWEVQGNLTLNSSNCGAPSFTNAGLVRKTAGSGAFQVVSCVLFTNDSILELQTGSFVVATSVNAVNAGLLDVGPGTTMNLNLMRLESGTTFSGAGTVALNGTTVVNTPVSMTVPVVQTGNTSGTGTIVLDAPMTWQAGLIGNAGGIEVNAPWTLTISTANQKVFDGAPLTNRGTVAWTGGTIFLQGNAAVANAATGSLDVQAGLQLTSSNCGSPTFANAGLLRRSGATGTFTVGSCVAFSNTGTVQLRLGGTGAGQYDVLATAGATLGGTLDVTLVNGFVPSAGNAFDVVTYGSRTGSFAVIDGHGQTYTPTYGANALRLQVP
ncbi:MAG: hypothetical protein R2745_08630 [Vicinamibacterales bacterium]